MKQGDTSLIFDINKITEFVFGDPNKRNSEVEITETFVYDDEKEKMVPNVREVKEVKVGDFTSQNTIKYDMIKMFIDILDSIEDLKVMTLGQSITLNTLESYEFIKEIKQDGNE
jgi:hypothetical protein